MFNGLEHVALGGFILLAAYIIQRRTWRLRGGRRDKSSYDEAQAEISALENAQRNELNRLQVKLHDFERMVDAKVQTRMLQLEQLLEQADQEIHRLNGEIARLTTPQSKPPVVKSQFSQLMHDAGFREDEVDQIAELDPHFKRAS
ncbi:MAG: hypothetical protein R3C11_17520 [Planctomycetaceae bacterium]